MMWANLCDLILHVYLTHMWIVEFQKLPLSLVRRKKLGLWDHSLISEHHLLWGRR